MDQVTMTILMLVVCFGLMYFFNDQTTEEKRRRIKTDDGTLEVGDSVLTTSGFTELL